MPKSDINSLEDLSTELYYLRRENEMLRRENDLLMATIGHFNRLIPDKSYSYNGSIYNRVSSVDTTN